MVSNSGRPPEVKRGRRDYTPEELGVDPARDQRIFTAVFLGMVLLLFIGAMILFGTLLYDRSIHKEKYPENPQVQSMATSVVHTRIDVHRCDNQSSQAHPCQV